MAFVAFSKFGSEFEVLGRGDDVLAGERHSEAQQTRGESADYVYHGSLTLNFWDWEH